MNRTLALIFLLSTLVVPTSYAAPPPLVLVLDASGSMWGRIGGETKVEGARRVVGEVSAKLGDGTPLAVIAYGHRREGDCGDIETVVPLAPLDRAGLKRVVDGLGAKGKTPLTAAFQHALGVAPAGANVVLVTDGLETCNADLCAVVRQARAKRADFVFHIIGLDVGKEDVSSLECAAQAGGGLYLPAANAAELGQALQSATALPPAAGNATLRVQAVRNGQLQDVAIQLTTLGANSQTAPVLNARTYTTPETNPRSIPLAAGRYQVVAQAVGLRGADERSFEVTLKAGEVVEHKLDYSTGTVVLGATRNGALSDVTYQLFRSGDRKRAVTTGRTYRQASSNPATFEVPIGTYEVVYTPIEIAGRPEHTFPTITVTAGQRSELKHDFVTGDLLVSVQRGAAFIDAVVVVKAGSTNVAQSRTYKGTDAKPEAFTLVPGRYEVEVAEIRGVTRRFPVTVTAGQPTRLVVDLAKP